mmetsp:Transcript_10896/g.24598  ORF Transcript_10896/g.24598 Transcript_10896/m.24598 type:complete len:276 (-) Transcript_10896:566-1393(-)
MAAQQQQTDGAAAPTPTSGAPDGSAAADGALANMAAMASGQFSPASFSPHGAAANQQMAAAAAAAAATGWNPMMPGYYLWPFNMAAATGGAAQGSPVPPGFGGHPGAVAAAGAFNMAGSAPWAAAALQAASGGGGGSHQPPPQQRRGSSDAGGSKAQINKPVAASASTVPAHRVPPEDGSGVAPPPPPAGPPPPPPPPPPAGQNMGAWGFASVPQAPVGVAKPDASSNPSATLRSLYFQKTQGVVSRGVAQGRTEDARTLGKHSRDDLERPRMEK